VAAVRDAVVKAVADADPHPSVVLLDLALTPEVDVPVLEGLEDLRRRLESDGVELWLSHLRPDARDLMERAGTIAAIGTDRIYSRDIDGILAYALRMPGAEARLQAMADILAFIRECRARPGLSAEGADTLAALDDRLSLELRVAEQAASPTADS
jgi:MFS superfamily sulfate permease-like transporter